MKSKFFNMAVFLVVLFGLVALNSCSGTDASDTTTDTTNNGGGTTPDTDDSGATPGDTTPGTNTSTDKLWKTFEGADLQIWPNGDSFTADDTKGYLEITVSSLGWWGGCYCDSKAGKVGTTGYVSFDMSKVAKITFDAKGSAAGSFWVSQSDKDSKVANQVAVTLTTDWVAQTYTTSGTSSTDYGVLDIGGGDKGTTTTAGYKVYIRNIAFLDASGKEIVPTRNTALK
jgi:hypothetical protein